MRKWILLFHVLIAVCTNLWATHNRSGEMLLKFLSVSTSGYEYEIQVVTYTNTASPIKRESLKIDFSDGSSVHIPKVSFWTITTYDPFITKNLYIGKKTFKNPGTYRAYMTDPNRNQGIINLGGVASVDVNFHIESEVVISTFVQSSLPDLTYPAIGRACLNYVWQHNPGVSGTDGDVFVYNLIPVKQGKNMNAPVYYTPKGMSINSNTGLVTWDTPTVEGQYNIAIEIKQYTADKRYKGFVVRDMQINVVKCILDAPELILNTEDICKTIDDTPIHHEIKVVRVPGNTVELSGFGKPFEFTSNPAKLNLDSNSKTKDTLIYYLDWKPNISQLILDPYTVYLQATYEKPSPIDMKEMKIGLAAKPVVLEGLNLNTNAVNLAWSNVHATASNLKQYEIFRSFGSIDFEPDVSSCQVTDAKSLGYLSVGKTTGNSLNFTDDTALFGHQYCYRVTPVFERGLAHTSNERCIETQNPAAIFPLQASVEQTDLSEGKINLSWKNPDQLDESNFTPSPPFYYIIERDGFQIFTTTSQDHLEDLQNSYEDTGLNTSENSYSYQVKLYDSNHNSIATSTFFKSLFLTLTPDDRTMRLEIKNLNVPWKNSHYLIFRKDEGQITFEQIGSTNTLPYVDKGLKNGKLYTYYIQSIGAYTSSDLAGLPSLINNSQEVSAKPVDNTPPPAPVLTLNFSDCDNFINQLSWQNGEGPVESIEDIEKYHLYYAPQRQGKKQLLASIEDLSTLTYKHLLTDQVAGCYQLSALDDSGNESAWSNEICVDNCYIYRLPNIFTPNNDGKNDGFKALDNKFVDRINLKIYDRQGKVIFTTQDKNFIWLGQNGLGKFLGDGIYFYTCDVYFISVDGLLKQSLSGSVTIIAGQNL